MSDADSESIGPLRLVEDFPKFASPYDGLFSIRHILALICIVITLGPAFYFFITWHDIVALWVSFGLLWIQLIWAVDKMPGLRLDTESYFKGIFVDAMLEETGRKTSMKRPITVYVVQYEILFDGRPMTIRKTLKPGVFDGDFLVHTGQLLSADEFPFSAFPEYVLETHHKRYRWWLRYFVPPLILTVLAIVFNMSYSYEANFQLNKDKIILVLITFGILIPISTIPLAYKIRRWRQDVTNGGQEITTIEMPTIIKDLKKLANKKRKGKTKSKE